ncbi:MAG: carboxymuconolactone decarboxylase family protein [Bacteroidales bacterium]|nr:carboxymuconolactone decarboxylase family protein [Bacteroidales bacterium]
MNPLDVFQKEAPEVAAAFGGLIEALKSTKGLDAKTKQLVYIGIKSAMGDALAIHYHVPMAKKLGASREEIKDTILITLSVCGLKGVATCLPTALENYDSTPE